MNKEVYKNTTSQRQGQILFRKIWLPFKRRFYITQPEHVNESEPITVEITGISDHYLFKSIFINENDFDTRNKGDYFRYKIS